MTTGELAIGKEDPANPGLQTALKAVYSPETGGVRVVLAARRRAIRPWPSP